MEKCNDVYISLQEISIYKILKNITNISLIILLCSSEFILCIILEILEYMTKYYWFAWQTIGELGTVAENGVQFENNSWGAEVCTRLY